MMNDGISVADALALRNTGNNNNGFGGGDGGWWIVLLILLFAGGWNRGGFGAGNGGDGANYYPTACCTPATIQGMTDAFNFNQLDNGLRGIQNGICDGFYTTAANISALQAALQNCCSQTQQSIANVGIEMAQGF